MPMTTCNECNTEVSDKSVACVKCGAQSKQTMSGGKMFMWIVLSLLLFFVGIPILYLIVAIGPALSDISASLSEVAEGLR